MQTIEYTRSSWRERKRRRWWRQRLSSRCYSTWQGHAVLGMGSLTGPRIPAPAPAGGGDGGGAVGGGAPLLIRRTFVGVAGDHVVYGGGGGGDNHATAPPGLNPLFVDFRINDKET
jgi:hypothetical protein